MATILAFAGSNSSQSINYQLVKHTVSLIPEHQIQLLNMAKYPFPMYSEDLERKEGYSNSLVELKNDIEKVDALIIAVNEHNSGPSAYFKNVLDWLSRLDRNFMTGKKVLLLSTAPGKRGGLGAITFVADLLPRFGATVVASFSLPVFKENFDPTTGIIASDLAQQHQEAVKALLASL